MSFLSKIIKIPTFSEQSKPDWSFTVAGLKIGGHSDGLPIYAINYISINHLHAAPAPVSSVPEPSIALLFAVGLVIVLAKRRL